MNRKEEVDKRREKEKRREQKELERMVSAAGGKPSTFATAGASTSTVLATTAKPAPSADAALPETSQLPKKGGFFKVAGASSSEAAAQSISRQQGTSGLSQSDVPAPPSVQPPPPPSASYSAISSAPRFTSTSSLAATWNPAGAPAIHPSLASSSADNTSRSTRSDAPKTGLASTWKPTSAPALHPLLGGSISDDSASATATEDKAAAKVRTQQERNDFFQQREQEVGSSGPFELPTLASSRGTTRAPKGMQFVVSASRASPISASAPTASHTGTPSMSLGGGGGGKGPSKKKPLGMEEDDDEVEDEAGRATAGGAPALPVGRPKARMPIQTARGGKSINFGRLG